MPLILWAPLPRPARGLVMPHSHRVDLMALVAFLGLLVLVATLTFPEQLETLRKGIRHVAAILHNVVRRVWFRSRHAARNQAVSAGTLLRNANCLLLRRRWLLAMLTTTALIPAAFLFRDPGAAVVSSYERTAHQAARSDGNVVSLLAGEHLVPPQPLPPAVFATREVELVRPKLATASRAWDRLDAAFAQQLLRVYQVMKERHGYDMVLIEGYRTPERQNELASMGTHVTRAAAFQSYHQFGLAADSAFLREGKLVISERDPWAMRGYELFGEVAGTLGLTWGGNWTMKDLGHVEQRGGRRVRR